MSIKDYLEENWKDYKRFPNTPEHAAYGDAIYLYNQHGSMEDFIDRLERNKGRVKNSRTKDKEYRKEVVNWYQIIIDKVKELNK